MLKGFRDFVLRGNVIDLAVGVIIGASFKTVVDKLVEGVINPALGLLVGKPNFDDAITFSANSLNGGELTEVKFGMLITAGINFVLTAGALYFFLVLPMNKALERVRKGETPPPAAPAEPSEEVKLLREIRDALKAENA